MVGRFVLGAVLCIGGGVAVQGNGVPIWLQGFIRALIIVNPVQDPLGDTICECPPHFPTERHPETPRTVRIRRKKRFRDPILNELERKLRRGEIDLASVEEVLTLLKSEASKDSKSAA